MMKRKEKKIRGYMVDGDGFPNAPLADPLLAAKERLIDELERELWQTFDAFFAETNRDHKPDNFISTTLSQDDIRRAAMIQEHDFDECTYKCRRCRRSRLELFQHNVLPRCLSEF